MKRKTGARKTPQLTPNALTVLKRRYLKRDQDGKVLEGPDDLFRRVADTLAEADRRFPGKSDTTKLADAFYRMMTWPDGEFEITACASIPARNIYENAMSLLMEGARMADESGDGNEKKVLPV